MGLGRVDRYELLALIGQGGFGGVYRAVHVHTGQHHALKMTRDAVDADATARALAEARTAGTLRHPNVVGIVDGGVAATGEAFVVMELLEGRTLAQEIAEKGPLTPMRAARIARQVLDGLAAAHGAGIVHRDVKPSNIFLTQVLEGTATNEVVKVIDFGISKMRVAGATHLGMTLPGVAIGTPGYMAPEQLGDARSVDPRADLYAVGIVIFEMLTKRRPIETDDFESWMRQLRQGSAPPLASVAPHLSPALCAVVDRAIAREPGARWPSALAMRSALEAALADLPIVGADAAPTVPGAGTPSWSPSAPVPAQAAMAAWSNPALQPTTPIHAPPQALSFPPSHAPSYAPSHGAPPPPSRSGSSPALYVIAGALVLLVGLVVVGGAGLFWFLSRPTVEPVAVSAPALTSAEPAGAPPIVGPAGGKPGPAVGPQAKPPTRSAPNAPTSTASPQASTQAPAAPATEPPRVAGAVKISAPKIVGELRQDAFFALAGRARSSVDQCNRERAAIAVRVDIMIAQNKVTIAQPSVATNPGDPTIARCAAQAFKDAQFAGFAPGENGIYQAAEISWK